MKNCISIYWAEGPDAKYDEKAEVLNAFFVPVFKRKTSYTQGNQSPELVHREQHRPPVTQQGVVSDVRHSKVHGAGWDPPSLEVFEKQLNVILSAMV